VIFFRCFGHTHCAAQILPRSSSVGKGHKKKMVTTPPPLVSSMTDALSEAVRPLAAVQSTIETRMTALDERMSHLESQVVKATGALQQSISSLVQAVYALSETVETIDKRITTSLESVQQQLAAVERCLDQQAIPALVRVVCWVGTLLRCSAAA